MQLNFKKIIRENQKLNKCCENNEMNKEIQMR